MITSRRHLGNTRELRKTIHSSENKKIYIWCALTSPSATWNFSLNQVTSGPSLLHPGQCGVRSPSWGQARHSLGMLTFCLVWKKKKILEIADTSHTYRIFKSVHFQKYFLKNYPFLLQYHHPLTSSNHQEFSWLKKKSKSKNKSKSKKVTLSQDFWI